MILNEPQVKGGVPLMSYRGGTAKTPGQHVFLSMNVPVPLDAWLDSLGE